MKMEQTVPKRWNIKLRRRVITQQNTYNIQNKAKVWNQEYMFMFKLINTSAAHIIIVVVGTKLRFFPTALCCEQREHNAYTTQSKIVTHTEIK